MFYNPLDKFYKSITGAVSDADKVIFRVKGNFDSVILRIKKDGDFYRDYKMFALNGYFEYELNFSVGLYFYHFYIGDGKFIGLGGDYEGIITDCPTDFQITSYLDGYNVPEILYGGIIYQIFPDRFCRFSEEKTVENGKTYHTNWNDIPEFLPKQGKILNNDFFGGDLKGIESKISYLKELGVTAIYLNPIFRAYSNHRYDTGNYMEIDSLLGNENDLISLISNAEKSGIKIILDGVFNHTGADSVYFNKFGNYNSVGAYQSKNSKFFNWYSFKSYPNEYESWWGIDTLPSINEQDLDFIDFITGKDGVIEKYTKMGVSGWRLDVVDELPDFFVEKIRGAVKRNNSQAVLIGEVWEDATNKIAYSKRREYFWGNGLDSVMNYPLKNAILEYVKTGNEKSLSFTIKEQIDHYPEIALHSLMNVLSTHDTYRLISALGDLDVSGLSKADMSKVVLVGDNYKDAKIKVKIASLLQYTLCGVPSIYYGDEIGMQGYSDPLNRQGFSWNNIDNELLEWFKFLGRLRADYSALSRGEFKEIYVKNGAFIYTRSDENSEIMPAVNLGSNELNLDFDGTLKDLISGKIYKNGVVLKKEAFYVFVAC